jgi:transposase-like protein
MSQPRLEKLKVFDLRRSLLEKGHTISSFARKHGYKPNTVLKVAFRYWMQKNSPRSILSSEILANLTTEIEPDRPEAANGP